MHFCCSHMAKTDFLMTRLILLYTPVIVLSDGKKQIHVHIRNSKLEMKIRKKKENWKEK